MTLYIGMSQINGRAITDTDHLRQSVRDILLTPQGSRIARREYGSLLSVLIDQPQSPALDALTISSNFDGSIVVDLTGQRNSGAPVSLSVSTGADNAGH